MFILLRGVSDHLHEEWLRKTTPVRMETVITGQPMRPNRSGLSIFNLLENFNVGVTLSAIFLLSFVGILSLSFLLNEFTRRIRFGPRRTINVWRRIVSALSSFGMTRLSAVGIFVLYVHLFIWLTQLFLANNIKVEV